MAADKRKLNDLERELDALRRRVDQLVRIANPVPVSDLRVGRVTGRTSGYGCDDYCEPEPGDPQVWTVAYLDISREQEDCDEPCLERLERDEETEHECLALNGVSPAVGDLVHLVRINAEWWILGGGSGGGCDTILFEIVDTICPESALVKVLWLPCGCSSVPEQDEVTEYNGAAVTASPTVVAFDRAGCNLVDPKEDLVGRIGWARYMRTPADPECEWVIQLICCADEECA